MNRLEITEQLVARKEFHWMPGMVDLDSCRVMGVDRTGVLTVTDWLEGKEVVTQRDPANMDLPDLTDPATVGCVMSMIHGEAGVRSLLRSPR